MRVCGLPAAAKYLLSALSANLFTCESGCWMVREQMPDSASQNLIVRSYELVHSNTAAATASFFAAFAVFGIENYFVTGISTPQKIRKMASTPEPILNESAAQQCLVRCDDAVTDRPLLAFFVCNLPSPQELNLDVLLEQLQQRMELLVGDSDYSLALFTSPATHRPPVRWMFNAYKQAVSRKFKKNLKAFYLVHAGGWVRLAMDAMKLVVSPKFARKLVKVRTLSQLASMIPLLKYAQLQSLLPPAVIEYNLTLESSVTLVSASAGIVDNHTLKYFGRSLELSANNQFIIPPPIYHCCRYIRLAGMDTEGIFRRSPSTAQVRDCKLKLDSADVRSVPSSSIFEQFDMPVHIAAALIKMYLRELYDPLFPECTYELLPGLNQISEEHLDQYFRSVLSLLPPAHLASFRYLFLLLLDLVSDPVRVSTHKMTPANLGVVFGPNLVKVHNVVQELETSRWAGFFLQRALESQNSGGNVVALMDDLLGTVSTVQVAGSSRNSLIDRRSISRGTLFFRSTYPNIIESFKSALEAASNSYSTSQSLQ